MTADAGSMQATYTSSLIQLELKLKLDSSILVNLEIEYVNIPTRLAIKLCLSHVAFTKLEVGILIKVKDVHTNYIIFECFTEGFCIIVSEYGKESLSELKTHCSVSCDSDRPSLREQTRFSSLNYFSHQ